ncbi:MAG TPA: helix-turn-helix domain-containing protein [Streptosporangiaceae bacterium]|nr:helix-turn-helix domain-containing protein [Streptosporangiaceae bacterium]
MMARMLSQLPLPLLPPGAAEIAPGVGLLAGEDGGMVAVHGLATFAWDAGDEAGRRLAAVQLVRLRAASQGQVAEAFGVDPATLWRWDQAVASGGVAGLVPARRGPKGASKLTPGLAARIAGLDAAGQTLRQIAAATGVSTFTVRTALGRARPGGQAPAAAGGGSVPDQRDGETAAAGEPLPVLPDPVPRGGERALARWGLLGEGAEPVFAPGARYPLAGLLLALPALETTGLLEGARQVYGQLKDGFYGLAATLLTLVFLALAGEPRAEGATRVPPAALGRVLGLDRAPEVKTIRRKLGELAAAGKAADLIMALARHHAGTRPEALGFLYADGHARVYYGTRTVQKTHVARLKFPAPATVETWVTDRDGDPVFMVVAEPSESLAGELRRLLPQVRQVVGEGRRVTVCFDRGGWSPALFADITEAGFDLLTWRKGPAPDVSAEEFTTITCTDDRGREHQYDLADTAVTLGIHDGPRKGQTVSLRQVTRRVPARHGGTRQIHALTSRTDLAAGEVCWRMTSRWREENYFRYARTHFALDALDSHAAVPDDPGRLVPNPAKKAAAAQVRHAEVLAAAAQAQRDASLAALRNPAPGQPVTITNQMINALDAPAQAADRELEAAEDAAAAVPARIRLGEIAPDMARLEAEVKQITHAIRMAAYNAETTLARALDGHYARAGDEAYALIREALTATGDICPGNGQLLIRLDPLTAPRRTQALAALCDQLNQAQACYPGTDLVLRYEAKLHHGIA